MPRDVLGKQHTFDALLVVTAHEGGVVEVALLGRLLFGQDVTVISMLALDFTGAGEGETLLGSGLGFHCRHYFTVFFKLDYILIYLDFTSSGR